MLCDELDRWNGGEGGGRLKRERIYVYIRLIHDVVQEKLTQNSNSNKKCTLNKAYSLVNNVAPISVCWS